mmetsp:Transcript_73013/g.123022  ORF Transcript_73013/g.123022 Transcript_73013/m.123022 type:complete len:100 (-) Transcript_73013:624-923(-)
MVRAAGGKKQATEEAGSKSISRPAPPRPSVLAGALSGTAGSVASLPLGMQESSVNASVAPVQPPPPPPPPPAPQPTSQKQATPGFDIQSILKNLKKSKT